MTIQKRPVREHGAEATAERPSIDSLAQELRAELGREPNIAELTEAVILADRVAE